MNQERNYVRILKEICKENGIELESFSYEWIFKLCKGNKTGYIFGYQFDLNSGVSQSICADKSATSDVLISAKIPCVTHTFFMSPVNQKYVSQIGNWKHIIRLLETHQKLVCKSNEGSGGNNVFLVNNHYELENAVHRIFKVSRSMAISPYYEIINEYRVIVLNNEIKLVYSKNRPYLMGDGISSVKELLINYLKESKCFFSIEKEEEYLYIPKHNEKFFLSWKHNLSNGAYADILNDKETIKKLSELALKATTVLNLKFVSIDIINTKDGLKILEINSGVMMERLSQQTNQSYDIVKKIYNEAIISMLEG